MHTLKHSQVYKISGYVFKISVFATLIFFLIAKLGNYEMIGSVVLACIGLILFVSFLVNIFTFPQKERYKPFNLFRFIGFLFLVLFVFTIFFLSELKVNIVYQKIVIGIVFVFAIFYNLYKEHLIKQYVSEEGNFMRMNATKYSLYIAWWIIMADILFHINDLHQVDMWIWMVLVGMVLGQLIFIVQSSFKDRAQRIMKNKPKKLVSKKNKKNK